jgi:hypothetical protein
VTDTLTALISWCWNYCVANIAPPVVEEEAPLLSSHMLEKNKKLEIKNNCAGEGQ